MGRKKKRSDTCFRRKKEQSFLLGERENDDSGSVYFSNEIIPCVHITKIGFSKAGWVFNS